MTEKSKKTFLITTIVGSFVLYCLFYYAHVFELAPYNFKEFKSFVIRYGTRNNMVNYYNSATGEYDYLNKHDSLVKSHLQLSTGDLDSLHQSASRLGFWDFPDEELNNDTINPGNNKAPRYYIRFTYKRKGKQVTFDANYGGPLKLIDANKILINKIRDVLSNADERQAKKIGQN